MQVGNNHTSINRVAEQVWRPMEGEAAVTRLGRDFTKNEVKHL